MAKPELGAKRQCQECGTKFFDLNKQKIVCPKCGAVFQAASPARASRAAAQDDDEKDAEAPADIVSLEDADGGADALVVTAEDVEIEDDEAADDTFLEEEEEDGDDVSALIDGDLENDEEV